MCILFAFKHYANDFSQGVARVTVADKSGCAFINTDGQPITEFKYDFSTTGREVQDGLIRVGAYSPAVTRALLAGEQIDYTVSEKGKTTIVMKNGKHYG